MSKTRNSDAVPSKPENAQIPLDGARKRIKRDDTCKITEPPEIGGDPIAVRVIPSTKIINVEGYIDQTISSLILTQDQVFAKDVDVDIEVQGSAPDQVNYTVSNVPTGYGKRTIRVRAIYEDDPGDMETQAFLALPQKWQVDLTAASGTGCATCANARKVFTLEYNTVVSGAWGVQLSSSNPDERICYQGCIRLSIASATPTTNSVSLAIKGTFNGPTFLVKYKAAGDWWDGTFSATPKIVLVPDGTANNCNPWPATIDLIPI